MARRRKNQPDVTLIDDRDVVVEQTIVVVETPAEPPVSVNPLDYLPADVEPTEDDQPGEAPAEPTATDPSDGEMDQGEPAPEMPAPVEGEDILETPAEEPSAAEEEPVEDEAPAESAEDENEEFFEEVTPDPVPLEVPSDVPGQPATVYPDGVEQPPFPTEGFEDVVIPEETPSPGIEPVYPDEEKTE